MSDIPRLPVRKKPSTEGRMLVPVNQWDATKCQHRGAILVDERLDQVECGMCHVKLNPMFVLRMLMGHETQWHRASERYQDEMARLAERTRTKCRHCGKVTPVSRR